MHTENIEKERKGANVLRKKKNNIEIVHNHQTGARPNAHMRKKKL